MKNYLRSLVRQRRTRSEKISRVKEMLSNLNSVKYYDTACPIGMAYHELPFREFNLPVHRKDLIGRVDLVEKYYPVRGKKGIDIGCAIGGVSFELAGRGASMIGVDINKEEIEIAQNIEDIFRKNCLFICDDALNISSNSTLMANCDFAIWFSQWMWLVKQHGIEHGKNALFHLSQKIGHLFFETSIGDAAAGYVMKEHGITSSEDVVSLLRECTTYASIVECRPARPVPMRRPIFYCSGRLRNSYRGYTSMVKRVGYNDVVKSMEGYPDLLSNEVAVLSRLRGLHFPKLISANDSCLHMTYCGEYLLRDNMPSDYQSQCREILADLAKSDVLHRDINPTNLLLRDGRIMLVDYSHAGRLSLESDAELPNERNGLTSVLGYKSFRHPDKFDHEYSLFKSIEYIMSESDWTEVWSSKDHM
jgi:SAM-dependent methyltransferase